MDDHANDDDVPSEASSDQTNEPEPLAARQAVPQPAAECRTEEAVSSDGSPPESPFPAARSGWRPSEYYASPRSATRFPRWVPLTCGVVAILAIGLMAVIGAFLQSGGLAKLVAFAFGQVTAEAEQMFDDGVAKESRATFKKSLLAVRDGVDDGTIELRSALPILQDLQKATSDRRLSVEEVKKLTGTFEESLARPSRQQPNEPPTVDL